MKNTILRATLAVGGALGVLVTAGGVASAETASPTEPAHAFSYFRYGTYPTSNECSAYGVAWDNAHPTSQGWFCIVEDGGFALYVDDGITD